VYEKYQHAFQEDFGARRQWSFVSGHIIRGSPVVWTSAFPHTRQGRNLGWF